MTYIPLSRTTPDALWVTISIMTHPHGESPDVNVMLWADEESAKHHMREAVRCNTERHGEHYAECAALDAMADWEPGRGAVFDDKDDYTLRACMLDVFLASPTGYRAVSLYRQDMKLGLLGNVPTSPHG